MWMILLAIVRSCGWSKCNCCDMHFCCSCFAVQPTRIIMSRVKPGQTIVMNDDDDLIASGAVTPHQYWQWYNWQHAVHMNLWPITAWTHYRMWVQSAPTSDVNIFLIGPQCLLLSSFWKKKFHSWSNSTNNDIQGIWILLLKCDPHIFTCALEWYYRYHCGLTGAQTLCPSLTLLCYSIVLTSNCATGEQGVNDGASPCTDCQHMNGEYKWCDGRSNAGLFLSQEENQTRNIPFAFNFYFLCSDICTGKRRNYANASSR